MKRPLFFLIGLGCALAAGYIIVSLYRSIQTEAAVPMPRLIIGVVLASMASIAFRVARR